MMLLVHMHLDLLLTLPPLSAVFPVTLRRVSLSKSSMALKTVCKQFLWWECLPVFPFAKQPAAKELAQRESNFFSRDPHWKLIYPKTKQQNLK